MSLKMSKTIFSYEVSSSQGKQWTPYMLQVEIVTSHLFNDIGRVLEYATPMMIIVIAMLHL